MISADSRLAVPYLAYTSDCRRPLLIMLTNFKRYSIFECFERRQTRVLGQGLAKIDDRFVTSIIGELKCAPVNRNATLW